MRSPAPRQGLEPNSTVAIHMNAGALEMPSAGFDRVIMMKSGAVSRRTRRYPDESKDLIPATRKRTIKR